MKTKIIIGIILVIILIGGVAMYQLFYNSDESATSYIEVSKSDIQEQVSATGSLVPLKKISLEPQIRETVEQVLVDVSDEVKKGDDLIKFNQADANIATTEAGAGLNSSIREVELLETRLENAKTDLQQIGQTTQRNIENLENEVKSAETVVENKEQNLKDVQENVEIKLNQDYEDARVSLGEEYSVADEAVLILDSIYDSYFADGSMTGYSVDSKVETSRAKLDRVKTLINSANDTKSANTTLEAVDTLKENLNYIKETLSYVRNDACEKAPYKSAVSSSDKTKLNTQKTNIESAISDITSAKQAITLQKVTNNNNINTAQAELNNAQASLNSAQSNLNYAKSQKEEKITQAESKISQTNRELGLKKSQIQIANAKLSKANQSFKDTIINAPVDGIITKVNIEEGETAKPGQSIIALLPDKKYKIEADISEVDIGRIKKSNKVKVDFDAFPQKVFEGYVHKIHPAEIVKEGVIYYRIEVMLNNYPVELRPGLTANLEIITGNKNNVLTVPYVAIESRQDKNYVKVLKADGSIQEKKVILGLEGETKVEVKKGLKQGEKVITYEQ